MNAYEKVKTARSGKRPTGGDYIINIFKNFIELHGDRRFSDDTAVIGGIGSLKGKPVTVIAIEKGHSAKERLRRHFGAPGPEGYRKALRLMKQAEKFRRPVICFVDTSGAFCGIGAEERGQGLAIAENMMEMMTLDTPVISVLIGEGGSGGALALSVADRVWMLENSVYSVISPEGCATILWKDAEMAPQAAEMLKLTAQDSLENGIIEKVISEDDIGTDEFYDKLSDMLFSEIEELKKDPKILEKRYARFRAFGRDIGKIKPDTRLYKKFCEESFDREGRLIDLELKYEDDFNYAYDVVDVIAAETPERRALVWCSKSGEERIFSFNDISRLSNKAANVFTEAGIKKGDRVMLALKRHYEYWIIAVALHKIGAVMVPVTHMLTQSDIVYRLKAADIKDIICTTENDIPAIMLSAVAEAKMNCRVWTVRGKADGCSDFTGMMKSASDIFSRVKTLATDHMALYFTSGTTGEPKGVIHDHRYTLAHIFTAKYWQQVEEGGLHFTVAETGWAKTSWGKMYGQWLCGSAVMVYDFDNFDPKKLVEIINKYKVTSFCAPPTVYRYLARKGALNMPSVRHASTAGETLHPEVFRRFKKATGINLCEGYGQTETALITANYKGFPAIEDSIGRPSPLYDVRLLKKDGTIPETGEVGEIVIAPSEGRSPEGIFIASLDGEDKYDEVWEGGVYHTGDAAYQDKDGNYWFYGRFDDIIKTGGFRVGPNEVENVLIKHPDVLECAVVGIPDKLRGQTIKAVVVPTRGVKISKSLEKNIKEFCNSRLAEYKWIRTVELLEQMPKTISGKIRKKDLK